MAHDILTAHSRVDGLALPSLRRCYVPTEARATQTLRALQEPVLEQAEEAMRRGFRIGMGLFLLGMGSQSVARWELHGLIVMIAGILIATAAIVERPK